MNKEQEALKNAIYNYARSYYPDIDVKKLAVEAERIADKVLGITCDAQSALTLIGVLLSIVDTDTK